jgi:uncharacterized protein (DUF885 family)
MSGLVIGRGGVLAAGAALAAMPAWAADSESARLYRFFEDSFRRRVARNPLSQTGLGSKAGLDRWPDPSEAHAAGDIALVRADLAALHRFDRTALTPEALFSWRLFDYQEQQALKAYRWRGNHYPVCQMRGPQRNIPQTLINNHAIADRADAEAYVARLRGVKTYLAAIVEGLEAQARAGVRPPHFSYAPVIGNCAKLIEGAPFDGGADSPMLADFKAKVAKLDLPAPAKDRLVADANAALLQGFGPGFRHLIDWLRASEAVMLRNDGVWSLPDGDAYYAATLDLETTLPISPQDIHKTGLEETKRIHDRMRGVVKRVGFDGTLEQFFVHLRTDPKFYYPDTPEGKAAYLDAMRGKIAAVEARLGEIIPRIPKGKVIVKAVEPWLEKSAGTAGYFEGTADGSRPGILYVNTITTKNLPTYELSSLSYHEGVPGHHLQNAVALELSTLPAFRRAASYTSYDEGWALYAEQLPYAMGLYDDPYQEFGQLSMELMRAGRLVVDSGLHHLRWTREQAIDWFDTNIAANHADNVKEIERYIVGPAQATAYETGKLKMMALRERAQAKLGAAFNLPRFNDALLGNGALPLTFLDETIDGWIARGGKA